MREGVSRIRLLDYNLKDALIRFEFCLGKFGNNRRTFAFFPFDGKGAAVQFDESFGNGQPQPKALLFIDFAFELHIGANTGNLVGGKSTSLVADGKNNGIESFT